MGKPRTEPVHRTTVTLPKRLHRVLAAMSEENHRTYSAELTVAVEQYIERSRGGQKTGAVTD